MLAVLEIQYIFLQYYGTGFEYLAKSKKWLKNRPCIIIYTCIVYDILITITMSPLNSHNRHLFINNSHSLVSHQMLHSIDPLQPMSLDASGQVMVNNGGTLHNES